MKAAIANLSLFSSSVLLLIFWGCSQTTDTKTEYPPHPTGWLQPNSANFHGAQISSLELCASCHGANLQGGSSEVSCYSCHAYPHASGWAEADSQAFHGDAVAASQFDLTLCSDCHYNAAAAAWSCWTCHNAFPHQASVSQPEHGGLLRAINYRVWECQECHGPDYSGGAANKSCLVCHTYGPEACNTCHGLFNADPNDTASWAPPKDLLGNSSSAQVTVGGHQLLVNADSVIIGGPYTCIECHVLPTTVDGITHLDTFSAQAEITFGEIATDDGDVDPVWNRNTATCSATYCHGNFKGGNSANPPALWTDVDHSQIACGTCHLLPPQTEDHPSVGENTCHFCHGTVVNANQQIIAPWLHVNGDVNVYE